MGHNNQTPEPVRKPIRLWLIAGFVIVLVVVGFFALRSRRPAEEITEAPPAQNQKEESAVRRRVTDAVAPEQLNVILITLDTLRTDRISCYGSKGVDTPNIDALARDGVRFTNAAGTVPYTLPAHSSMMTGTYPPHHGVRENVGALLPEEIPTLAERLRDGGWATAAFVSAFVLDKRWGIGRGFDHYFDDFDLKEFDTPNMGSVQRTGDETVAEAVRWIDERPAEQPFFLWLHLYDPHEPYTPPEPYSLQYADRPYDGEVAFTDSLIGDFRRALDERDLLEKSLVILTSDHGEGLGDHGEMFHGYYVYDSTIHVALIVRPPLTANAGRVVDAAVSHVDLMPTVLDAVALPYPDLVHGRSLVPLMFGAQTNRQGGVYSESMYPLLHYGWAPLRSLRTDRFKLIDAPRSELFDLVQDPREGRNLVETQPDRSVELEIQLARLREEIETGAPSTGQEAELDEQTLAQLQALGYMAGQGGVTVEEEEDISRADPKDKLVLHQAIMAAQSRMELPETAIQILEEVLAEDDTIVDAHHTLGRIAGNQERFEDAATHFQRVLELDPNNKNSMMGLASTYAALKRFDDALVGYQRVIEVSGQESNASIAMADIHVTREQYPEAAQVLETAIAAGASQAIVYNKLGEVRVEQGRSNVAASLFERAIEQAREFPMPYFNLGVIYEERGNVDRAVSLYERAIELEPGFFKAQFNLGRLYGKMGRVERQRELWEASIESNPKFVQGLYHLGLLLLETNGDLGRAEELARQGIELDPEHEEGPLGYYVLADLLNRQRRFTEAREAVAKGQEIQAAMKR
jgi:arylsulfatase A-like enzyme/Flp pilus assembly protein TadD